MPDNQPNFRGMTELALTSAYDALERLLACRVLEVSTQIPDGTGVYFSVLEVSRRELTGDDDVAVREMMEFLDDWALAEFNLTLDSSDISVVCREILDEGTTQYKEVY
jgi:hypothetical protein